MKKKAVSLALVLALATGIPACNSVAEGSSGTKYTSGTNSSSGVVTTPVTSSDTDSSATVTSTVSESVTGVKVNWDSYKPSTMEENVYTRFSETTTTDFIPSDKYGELIPYFARHMLTTSDSYYGGTNPVGFLNDEGVLICDPIFDTCVTLPNGDYLVGKYKDACSELIFREEEEENYEDSDASENDVSSEEDDAHLPRRYHLYHYGILSHDGSSFTGLIYDGYNENILDPNSDTIYLYSFEDKTTKVTPYRCSERKTEDPFRLSFTPDSYPILSCLNSQTVVFTSIDGFFGMYGIVRLDGTQPKLALPEGVDLCRIFGTAFLYHGDEESMDSEETFWNIYSFKDNKCLPYFYFTFSHITADRVLMVRTDGYDVVDGDGHIVSTLDNSEHKWSKVSAYGEYAIGLREDTLVIMDREFKEKRVIENCTDPYFVLQKGMNSDPEADRFYGEPGIIAGIPLLGLEPIMSYASFGRQYLYNINTEATYDCSAYDRFYQHPSGYIICHKASPSEEDMCYDPWNPAGTYKILDAKDMHVIYEGEDLYQVLQDTVTGMIYLFQCTRNENSGLNASLIELQTGRTIWEMKEVSSTPVYIVPRQVVNGHFCYAVYGYEYELSDDDDRYIVSDLQATVMQDENGKVLFRYKAQHQEED